MCNYKKAWVNCNNEIIDEKLGFCEEHSKEVCSVCGGQSVKECDGSQVGLVCGAPLCNNEECKEGHYLLTHSSDLTYFLGSNYHKNKGTVKVLFTKIQYNEILSVLNDFYKERFVQILLWEVDGKYKLIGSGGGYYFNSKEEILQYTEEVFGLDYCDSYFSDDIYTVNANELYDLSKFDLLRKAPKDIKDIFDKVEV